MKYHLPLLLLVISAINGFVISSSAFAAVEAHSLELRAGVKAETNVGQDSEKEYVESKHFPKKGKYLDWIEANKLSNKGVRLARSGQFQQAIPYFQQAIQRYGHDYTYYENLGAAQHKSGNLERAESTTEMAAHMAPRRWGPWFNLGLILTKQHEYKRALAALRKAKALKAPAAKITGINRLISALEIKLDEGNAAATASSTAKTNSSQNQTEATEALPRISPQQKATPALTEQGGSSAAPSAIEKNPVATPPAITPEPAAAASVTEPTPTPAPNTVAPSPTSEKGN